MTVKYGVPHTKYYVNLHNIIQSLLQHNFNYWLSLYGHTIGSKENKRNLIQYID